MKIAPLQRRADIWTVLGFCSGALLCFFEGRFPEAAWLIITFSCFAASTIFGIVALRQGKMWPLPFAVLSGLLIFLAVIGIAVLGGV